LIINVGHDVVEKPPFFMQADRPLVVHVNFFSARVDPVYFPQVELVGDIANSLWQLNEALEPSPSWDHSVAETVREALARDLAEGVDSDAFPLRPPRVVADVRKVLPDDGVLSLDNGMYKIWFARSYPARRPNTVLLDNALATMGAGLPNAIAAKLLQPETRVLALCGDGGFMMNSQELETAVRLGLDLVVLILNDSGYGMIKWKQAGMGFADHGLDFGNPCFIKYADSYGARGHRIESADQLAPTLEQCFQDGGVHLVDCPIDYSDDHRNFNEDLPRRSAALELPA
ncbi:MAG: thiamine pyrophosphate-dependent enzyme, partial [Acidobacteriota bacterium]